MSLFKISLGIGLLALSAGFVACSSDDDKNGDKPDSGDTGGSPSTGGKPGSGGDTEAGAGGSSTGGSSTGGATEAGVGGSAEGGPGPTDGGGTGGDGAVGDGGGMSLGKLCNDVALGSGSSQQSVTFRIVIGEGTNAVNLEAASGTCSPAVNLPCTLFASGKDIPVDLYDKTDLTTALDGIAIDAVNGETVIFGVELDVSGASPRPKLVPYGPTGNATCSSIDIDDVYPPNLAASANASSSSGYSKAR